MEKNTADLLFTADCSLLECVALQSGRNLLTFSTNMPPSFSIPLWKQQVPPQCYRQHLLHHKDTQAKRYSSYKSQGPENLKSHCCSQALDAIFC